MKGESIYSDPVFCLTLPAGLARLSSNPALRWSVITYVELIRGSPLRVQIFIWYFVLGTVVNTILMGQGFDSIPQLWTLK